MPFGSDFLSREWPFLLGACSLPLDATSCLRVAGGLGDGEILSRLAGEHGVAAQVAAALGSLSSASAALNPALQTVRALHRTQSIRTLALTAELPRVLELLRRAQVETLVVKGPVLALRAYGDPAARQFGDIDLLVRHCEIQSAAKAMVAGGYESKVPEGAIGSGRIPGQYLFRGPNNTVFELHTQRTLRYFPRPLPIEELLQRKVILSLDGRSVPALSVEDEFVLISVHGAKHFWERLMWISDVAAMIHRHPGLHWARISTLAAQVGAERMVRVAALLAERLLRVPVPLALLEADAACLPVAKKIETWLPYAGHESPPLAQRALFRLRMRGELLAGARYLTRLSLSTTEEDWAQNPDLPAGSLRQTLRRPFRLARKHRRKPEA